MQLSRTPSKYEINYEELKNRKFQDLDAFKAFCEGIGISFDDNFAVADDRINYQMGALAVINSDGSVEFSVCFKISTNTFKIAIERAIANSKRGIEQQIPAIEPASTRVSDNVRRQLNRIMLAYCAKGGLEFDETTWEYFIRGYDSAELRNDVEVRFKLEDISWIQDYETGEDKSDENDEIFYSNVQNYLKELIDSGSILLLHDRSSEGKNRIEIEVQFDLRGNLQQ